MSIDDFLLLFERPMNRCDLAGVRLITADKNDSGAKYYEFIGLIVFKPPSEILAADNPNENSGAIINALRTVGTTHPNKVFRKRFKRKVQQNKKVSRWTFDYFFEILPETIIGYEVDVERERMKLHVKGYGKFS